MPARKANKFIEGNHREHRSRKGREFNHAKKRAERLLVKFKKDKINDTEADNSDSRFEQY